MYFFFFFASYRSLFASKPIKAGDCILKVPFSVVCSKTFYNYIITDASTCTISISIENLTLYSFIFSFWICDQHISVDKLPLEMIPLISNEVDPESIATVALLAEQKLGQVLYFVFFLFLRGIKYIPLKYLETD